MRAARAALGQLDPGGYVHRFERTVDDEIQALLAEPTAVGAALSQLNSLKQWSIGIGIGAVDTVGQTSVSSAGPAFVAAREAVARARSKGMPMPIAVRVAEPTPASAELAQHAQGLAQLLGAVERRRSPAGWEAIEHVRLETQTEAARPLLLDLPDRLGQS